MFFIPEKGRFYRWAVHTPALYRWGITLGLVAVLVVAWFFVLDPWLTGIVQYEQAALNRAGQQQSEALIASRASKVHDMQLQKTNASIQELAGSVSERDQIAFLFDAAQKAGVSIHTFTKEKDKQKEWRTKKYASLSASGRLDQFFSFFSAIADSSHMIQCKRLVLQRTDQNVFSAQCHLECITLQA